ncbi:xanthine phosphoribosyltransferase [Veillonella magna]|jgi:xanthine phosphoribosyltransferase|uniref:Xanthine phosphoribosyltransferase n=1 Tax=Veillonella magna TaxID=464322 RepID=A0ABS2GGM2_9FIRM|nr:xanthine phosphoribosyltransferase [Veillonella magna]MBD8975415.1 xanthine phosphoribosyltransferase [Veillonella magna]MBM6825035.1 xanthine phosphoribosyltransferase [Veillonella magna]MBM6913329.1 xanthine phosphoribosyltransferase [Veillonella magna]
MDILKQRINEEGIVLNNRVLKVDSFLNHQIDPKLFVAIGKEIAARFKDAGIERIVTIEASGIAIALQAAIEMDVPLVFARKKKSILMTDDVYHSVVYSYTKEENYDVTISKRFLPAGEKVLIIDDFLASGEAAMGLAKLVESAGDTVEGIAIVIEKSFQPGRERLERAGYNVQSLVRIKAFEDNHCVFMED